MSTAIAWKDEGEDARRNPAEEPPPGGGLTGVLSELERLRAENRRLAVSLGAFSAFIASRGLLEEAWSYVHGVHGMDE